MRGDVGVVSKGLTYETRRRSGVMFDTEDGPCVEGEETTDLLSSL